MTILSILLGLVIGLFSAIAMILVVIALCVKWWDYRDKKQAKALRKSTAHQELLRRIEEHVGPRDFDSPLEREIV